jgi:hypothetical protein
MRYIFTRSHAPIFRSPLYFFSAVNPSRLHHIYSVMFAPTQVEVSNLRLIWLLDPVLLCVPFFANANCCCHLFFSPVNPVRLYYYY